MKFFLVAVVLMAWAATIGLVFIDRNYATDEGRATCTVTQMNTETEYDVMLPERRTVWWATLKCYGFTLDLRSRKQKVFTQEQWDSLAGGDRFECEHIVHRVFRSDNARNCKKVP